jgi:hypothetical protein
LVVSSCDWIGEVEEGDQNDLDKYVIKHWNLVVPHDGISILMWSTLVKEKMY